MRLNNIYFIFWKWDKKDKKIPNTVESTVINPYDSTKSGDLSLAYLFIRQNVQHIFTYYCRRREAGQKNYNKTRIFWPFAGSDHYILLLWYLAFRLCGWRRGLAVKGVSEKWPFLSRSQPFAIFLNTIIYICI